MTESDRHRNSVTRLKAWLEKIGAEILSNTDDGGKGGYKFPAIVRQDGRIFPYIADVFAKFKGIPIVFEIDLYHHESKQARTSDRLRTEDLQAFGLTVIRFTPTEVDLLTEDLLLREIHFRVFGKLHGRFSYRNTDIEKPAPYCLLPWSQAESTIVPDAKTISLIQDLRRMKEKH